MTLLVIHGFDADQLPVSIMKLVEFSLYLFAAIKIHNSKKKEGKQPIHHLFIASFVGWAIFLLIGSMIMLFGAINPESFSFSEGLWRFLIILTVMNSYLLYLSSLVISKGSYILKENIRRIELVFFLVLSVLLAININLVVENELGELVSKNDLPYIGEFEIIQRYTALGQILVVIPFVVYFVAVVYLLNIQSKVSEMEIRSKMRKMIAGLFCIFLGYLYFTIIGISGSDFNLIVRLIGHIFWIMAPILLYLSQKQ